jgi:hypothetical protein
MEGGSRYVAGRTFAPAARRGAACRDGADDRGSIKLKSVASSIIAAAVIAGLPMTGARACTGFGLWQTIFLEPEDLAKGVDSPVAADVTIVATLTLPASRLLLTAHVNETIRGSVDGDDITIALSPSTCDEEIQVGLRGIVAGQMSRDARGKPEFIAISETRDDRERRRRARFGHE